MQLYNSLGRKLEPFNPQSPRVSIYVCGITPYDTTHLGHAFTYLTVDLLVRYLRYRGHDLLYVQNVTDIDDDILRKAVEVGEDWLALGNRWTRHFIDDMLALNALPPDHYPRATEMIPEIIEDVGRLLESGVAYLENGSVYFEIECWPDYGKLCCLPRERMLPVANERGNKADDPNKRHPLDFVLWQARVGDEPAWDSPWGWGRPGWHIECSTMATRLIGEVVDIHAGGSDLIYPHHESEIAQVEPLTPGSAYVRHWLHVAMVSYQGEKMSKSIGNLVMVRDLLKIWSPNALRLYLAGYHYRTPWSYEAARLGQSAAMAAKWQEAWSLRLPRRASEAQNGAETAFRTRMEDDLDAPGAIRVLDALADEVLTGAALQHPVFAQQQTLRRLAGVLGLIVDPPEEDGPLRGGWERHRQRFPA